MARDEKDLAFNSFGMVIAFLTEALIDEQTITPGDYHIYTPENASIDKGGLDYMVLDAQALQHLEIVEAADGSEKGSLLHYVDHCSTAFGKRMLKNWLMAPLQKVDKI